MDKKHAVPETNWNRWYVIMLLVLIFEIFLFDYLTRHFQ